MHYAADIDTRRSRNGSAWNFGGRLVSNQSKLQPPVTLSTAEAGLCVLTMNVTFALRAIQWVKESEFEINEPVKLRSNTFQFFIKYEYRGKGVKQNRQLVLKKKNMKNKKITK
jgi:hypothetical protein